MKKASMAMQVIIEIGTTLFRMDERIDRPKVKLKTSRE